MLDRNIRAEHAVGSQALLVFLQSWRPAELCWKWWHEPTEGGGAEAMPCAAPSRMEQKSFGPGCGSSCCLLKMWQNAASSTVLLHFSRASFAPHTACLCLLSQFAWGGQPSTGGVWRTSNSLHGTPQPAAAVCPPWGWHDPGVTQLLTATACRGPA